MKGPAWTGRERQRSAKGREEFPLIVWTVASCDGR
jgi:hypothetical protein